MRNKDSQPLAFALRLGSVRASEPEVLSLDGGKIKIPKKQRTMTVIGYDYQSGDLVGIPYKGDPWQSPQAEVIEAALYRNELQMLADGYKFGGETRSPKVASSRGLPEQNITDDAVDSSTVAKLLVTLERVNVGGFQSVMVQLELVMGLAQKLEALGWRPPGPHLDNDTQGEDTNVEW